MKYAVKIQTGTGPYRWLHGWDAEYPTRKDAEAVAEQAEKNDGWSARVVELPDA